MLPNVEVQKRSEGLGSKIINATSKGIISIAAELRTWLTAVEKIEFSEKPDHEPDPDLVNEIVVLLSSGERTSHDN